MANPPGGPLSGGMEAQQNFAQRTIQEKQAAQQQPVQQEQQPTQQQQTASTPGDRQPSAEDRNLDENERRAVQQAQERARIQELAQKFAPSPQQEQQTQPQRQAQQQNEL